jgi:hypothetical protein
LEYLRRDTGPTTPTADLLTAVVVDSEHGQYGESVDHEGLRQLGVMVIDLPLVDPANPTRLDSRRLLQVLLSLA